MFYAPTLKKKKRIRCTEQLSNLACECLCCSRNRDWCHVCYGYGLAWNSNGYGLAWIGMAELANVELILSTAA